MNNKKLGSSELVNLLNSYFLSIKNKKLEISKIIKLVKIKLGHFEAVNNYLNELNSILGKKDKSEFINFLSEHANQEIKKFEIIFDKIYPHLKKIKSIITLSRSGTVLEILKHWHQKNKKIEVVICESRPKFEGRLLAEEIAKIGIKTLLISDAMMSLYVSKVDAAIIGADSVLKNGNVINKVGSKSLALLCKEYKKSFFVVTMREKFSNGNTFYNRNENPKEIFDKKMKNLSVKNIYFEEIEQKFITKIITDRSRN
ncbi:MAG: hypothetical protein OQJ78_10910 [Ignavibacteriaceae bacterium]|nr:hypothetical protein [Ignavibacteriaceae bacterium]